MFQFTDPCLHEDTEYSVTVFLYDSEVARSELMNTQQGVAIHIDLVVDQGLVYGETYLVVATGSNVLGQFSLINDTSEC